LGLPGAVVLAQPVVSNLAIDRETMEAGLAEALKLAESKGIRGKAVTPFLLGHISQATGGRSLSANQALIVDNARLAGQVATSLAPG
jgi:pseudouridine-5'-phosphate glycosidase